MSVSDATAAAGANTSSPTLDDERAWVHELHLALKVTGCTCPVQDEYTPCRCGWFKPAAIPLCRRCARGRYWPSRD